MSNVLILFLSLSAFTRHIMYVQYFVVIINALVKMMERGEIDGMKEIDED